MTTTLHLQARAGAAVACDMRNAVVFTFGGGAETQAWVEDLASRRVVTPTAGITKIGPPR